MAQVVCFLFYFVSVNVPCNDSSNGFLCMAILFVNPSMVYSVCVIRSVVFEASYQTIT